MTTTVTEHRPPGVYPKFDDSVIDWERHESEVDWEVVPFSMGPTWDRNPFWDGPRDPQGYILPKLTLGWQILDWIAANLLADETDENGNKMPFDLTDEQKRFILWFYALDEGDEYREPTGRFKYREYVLQRLKGHGKDPLAAVIAGVEFVGPCRFAGWAVRDMPEIGVMRGDPIGKPHPRAWVQIAAVSLEQPLALTQWVRTTDGWKTVGDLTVGDHVFDERGQSQPVMRETPIMTDLDCYEVVFDDGQSVVASAGHGWTVDQAALHDGCTYTTRTVTTADLAHAYTRGQRQRIPNASIDTPDRDLPVDPYLLGLWLADGSVNSSTIAIDHSRRAEIEEILRSTLLPTETLTFAHHGGNWGTVTVRNTSRHAVNGPALRTRLRSLEVLNDKHVPLAYLQAGTEQRRALLQGLLDGDGHIANASVGFTNVNESLIDAVVELARSLGYKPRKKRRADGAAWVVRFTPDETPVFRMRHKVERQAPSTSISTYRFIKDVRRVESVPVKCIGIDTPAHLFQVEGGILTHNTKNTMTLFQGLFTDACVAEHSIDVGKTVVYAHGGQKRIEAVTSSPASLEGNRPTLVIKNETHHWKKNNDGFAMAEAIERNATKSKGGAARTLSITNAYEPSSESVARQERESYESQLAGDAIATGMLYDTLEAPKAARLRPIFPDEQEKALERGIEPIDPNVKERITRKYIARVLEAVRGGAWWLDIQGLTDSILSPKSRPSLSRRFWYNQIWANEDSWVHPDAVDAAIVAEIAELRRTVSEAKLIVEAGWQIVGREDPIVAFFDGSKSDDSTAIVGCRVVDGYCFLIGVWQKPNNKERAKTWLAPRNAVDRRVDEMFERFNVVAFWGDPSHAKDDEEDESSYWMPMLDKWMQKYKNHADGTPRLDPAHWPVKGGLRKHAINFDMTAADRTKAFLEAAEQTVEDFETFNDIEEFAPAFQIDGHPTLVQHLKNAVSRADPRGWGTGLAKEQKDSPRKIDAAVCLVGARMLRRLVLNLHVEEEEEDAGEIWF